MATIQTESALNANIAANIFTNSEQATTGNIVRDELLDIVKSALLRKRNMTAESGNIKLDDRNGYLYGFDTAITGNITIDDATLVIGAKALIKHNHTAAPTFTAATATVSQFGSNYIASQNNYYLLKVVSATEILVQLLDNTSHYLKFSTADPEGSVTAPQGCLYVRFGAGYNKSLYIKEAGAENTGWRAVKTSSKIYLLEDGGTLDIAGSDDPNAYHDAVIWVNSTDTNTCQINMPAYADVDEDWKVRIVFSKDTNGNPILINMANDTDGNLNLANAPYNWSDQGAYTQLKIGDGSETHIGAFTLARFSSLGFISGFHLVDYTSEDREEFITFGNTGAAALVINRQSKNMSFSPDKAYTGSSFAGFRNGQSTRLRIKQPVGGPYDIALPASNVIFAAGDPYCKVSSGNKITDMAASQTIDVEIQFDGTDYYVRTLVDWG